MTQRRKKRPSRSPSPLPPNPPQSQPPPSSTTPTDPSTSIPLYEPITLKPATPLGPHLHHFPSLLLLTFYITTFSSLVAYPVRYLTLNLLTTSLTLALYLYFCLPLPNDASTSLQPKKTKKARKQPDLLHLPAIASVASILLSLILGTPLLYILLVLHGAPLSTHIPHTALLAAHLSLLIFPPLLYTRSFFLLDTEGWRALAGLALPADETFGGALGAVLGAWLGAVPIPLDWDREWQKWPVTVVAGAYAGWAVGRVVGESRWVRGGRVSFEEAEQNKDDWRDRD